MSALDDARDAMIAAHHRIAMQQPTVRRDTFKRPVIIRQALIGDTHLARVVLGWLAAALPEMAKVPEWHVEIDRLLGEMEHAAKEAAADSAAALKEDAYQSRHGIPEE